MTPVQIRVIAAPGGDVNSPSAVTLTTFETTLKFKRDASRSLKSKVLLAAVQVDAAATRSSRR